MYWYSTPWRNSFPETSIFVHPHECSKMASSKPLLWERFRKDAFSMAIFTWYMWTVGQNQKKISVFKQQQMCRWGLMLICNKYIHGKITCRMNILHFYIISGGCIRIYCKSSIKPPSQLAFPPPSLGKKVNKPPLPSPNYSSVINDRLYLSITNLILHVDWSGIFSLLTGSSDLILIRSCMTSTFLYLSFSTLYSSSLWRTDTIVVSKLNKPPLPQLPTQISPLSILSSPSNGLEINKPPPPTPPQGLKDLR